MRRAGGRDRVPLIAVLTAVGVALVAVAAARAGPVAALLAIPAGLLVGAVGRRVEARESDLRLLTQLDALTGLGNRRLLDERLGYEITRHRRHERRFVLLAMDLDGFKAVNDRFGHQAGDEVLREVARGLERAVRDQDTVVRMGGDEFCVLAPETSWPEAERLADRLRDAVSGAVSGLEHLSASVGYAIFPDEGWTAEELLEQADASAIEFKRRARSSGRGVRRAA